MGKKVSYTYKRAVRGDNPDCWLTEEKFSREATRYALIKLYSAKDTDEDVDEVQLSPVKSQDDYFVKIAANSVVDYTEEESITTKSDVQQVTVTRVINGNTYTQQEERFTPDTRWREEHFSNVEFYDEILEVVDNGAQHDPAIPSTDAHSAIGEHYVDLSEGEIAAFPKLDNKKILEKVHAKLKQYWDWRQTPTHPERVPGTVDYEKTTVNSLDIVSVPVTAVVNKKYWMTFEYCGKRGKVYQYSNWDEPKFYRETVSVKKDRDGYEKKKVADQKKREDALTGNKELNKLTLQLEAMKDQKWKAMKLPIGCLIGSIAFCFIFLNLFIFGALAVIACSVWTYTTQKKVVAKYDPEIQKLEKKVEKVKKNIECKNEVEEQKDYEKRLRFNRKVKKLELLKKRLAKMGLEPLTNEEIRKAFGTQALNAVKGTSAADMPMDNDEADEMPEDEIDEEEFSEE